MNAPEPSVFEVHSAGIADIDVRMSALPFIVITEPLVVAHEPQLDKVIPTKCSWTGVIAQVCATAPSAVFAASLAVASECASLLPPVGPPSPRVLGGSGL